MKLRKTIAASLSTVALMPLTVLAEPAKPTCTLDRALLRSVEATERLMTATHRDLLGKTFEVVAFGEKKRPRFFNRANGFWQQGEIHVYRLRHSKSQILFVSTEISPGTVPATMHFSWTAEGEIPKGVRWTSLRRKHPDWLYSEGEGALYGIHQGPLEGMNLIVEKCRA